MTNEGLNKINTLRGHRGEGNWRKGSQKVQTSSYK